MTDATPLTDDATPAEPVPTKPDIEDEKLRRLVDQVSDAIRALPKYWASATNIEGLGAFDLFSLNSVLGGTIEVQTVATLNRIREVWDPDDEWGAYGFERSSQTFPDVRLVRRTATGPEVALGIELKGWYLLSKEKEPSFRYTATPAASAPQDLIVVVPWHLSNVLSGVPVVFEPYIESSGYAARMRNYYWEVQRGRNETVTPPATDVHPYMPPKAKIADTVTNDTGKNFGRLARVHGLMKGYCETALETEISGIEARHWISFVKTYTDATDRTDIDAKVQRIMARNKRADGRSAELANAVTTLMDIVFAPEA